MRTAIRLAFVLACLCPSLAWSGISLEVTAVARLEGDRFTVTLTTANKGDQPALNLVAELIHPRTEVQSAPVNRLPGGGSVQLTLTAPAPAAPPGRQAIVALIAFTDPNGHAFSALGWTWLHRGRDMPSPVVVKALPLDLGDRADLDLTLINPDREAANGRVKLFCPKELTAVPEEQPLVLPPRGSADLGFRLINQTGLVGAGYPILILVEHPREGFIAGRMTQTSVRLIEPNPFKRKLKWWLAAAGALAALGLILELRRRGRR